MAGSIQKVILLLFLFNIHQVNFNGGYNISDIKVLSGTFLLNIIN